MNSLDSITYRWSPDPPESDGFPQELATDIWNLIWLTMPYRASRTDLATGDDGALIHSMARIAMVNGRVWTMPKLLCLPMRHFLVLCRFGKWDEQPALMAEDVQWRKHWAARAKKARVDHPMDLNLMIESMPHYVGGARRLLEEKGWATTFPEAS